MNFKIGIIPKVREDSLDSHLRFPVSSESAMLVSRLYTTCLELSVDGCGRKREGKEEREREEERVRTVFGAMSLFPKLSALLSSDPLQCKQSFPKFKSKNT